MEKGEQLDLGELSDQLQQAEAKVQAIASEIKTQFDEIRRQNGAGPDDPLILEDVNKDPRTFLDLTTLENELKAANDALDKRNERDQAAVKHLRELRDTLKQEQDFAARKRATLAHLDTMCAYFASIIEAGVQPRLVSDSDYGLDQCMLMKEILLDLQSPDGLDNLEQEIRKLLGSMRDDMDLRLNRTNAELKVRLEKYHL